MGKKKSYSLALLIVLMLVIVVFDTTKDSKPEVLSQNMQDIINTYEKNELYLKPNNGFIAMDLRSDSNENIYEKTVEVESYLHGYTFTGKLNGYALIYEFDDMNMSRSMESYFTDDRDYQDKVVVSIDKDHYLVKKTPIKNMMIYTLYKITDDKNNSKLNTAENVNHQLIKDILLDVFDGETHHFSAQSESWQASVDVDGYFDEDDTFMIVGETFQVNPGPDLSPNDIKDVQFQCIKDGMPMKLPMENGKIDYQRSTDFYESLFDEEYVMNFTWNGNSETLRLIKNNEKNN